MEWTVTFRSTEAYLAVLEVLDTAVKDGKLDFEFSVKPALGTLPALAAHAARIYEENSRGR